jgi:demethylmenaquinone methyltransferase/2-methoxy-6-polyprenyl-1,4-benzoquinol methylase
VVREMFDRIAPRYDLVNRVMTFGMDASWRRRAVRSLGLSRGSLVVDVACGTGELCRELRAEGMHAVGLDASWGMLEVAREPGPLVQADGLRMPFADGVADGITCGFALRNVVDLQALFSEFARVLRPGGRFAILEVDEPDSPVTRTGHRIYFQRVVPLIGRILSDRDAYAYLPASTVYLPPPQRLKELMNEAGLRDVEREPLSLGAAQLITGSRDLSPH